MLASIVASKAARMITLCVCPVVGAGTIAMSVPKVRQAVHKATAPREYALPKTRERLPAEPVSLAAPCLVATPESAGFVSPPPFDGPVGPLGGPDRRPYIPGGGDAPPGTNPGNPIVPPGGSVPEPHAWLQLLLGFTLIGGAIRLANRKPNEDELEVMSRVDALTKDVPR